MADLLPCPFCGGAAERVDNCPTKDGGSFIRCTQCDASTAIHFDRRENLYSSWNERKSTVEREQEAIAAEARRCASFYSAGTDGRNTFTIFAEWVERRSLSTAMRAKP